MFHRLLLIEHDPVVPQPSLATLLTAETGFQCERRTWQTLNPDSLRHWATDLLIAVALEDLDRCFQLIGSIAADPHRAAILAVLPNDGYHQLLPRVLETVDEFVFSPVRDGELRCRLRRLLGQKPSETATATEPPKREPGLQHLVGADPVFLRAIERLSAIAKSNAPVLLLGETGTGKELCAQAIHALSERSTGPFVPVECGAIPENLMENELFGHMRGAFTDANTEQQGLVAIANGGSLFLDEVDMLPLAAQAKLLRFVQEGSYRRLGAQRYTSSDARLIAASNRDMTECLKNGQFRPDLYFRLNVLPLRLPPLRERREDIPILAEHFLRVISKSTRALKTLSPSAVRVLQTYHWPGNVRELFNVMHRAVAFSPSSLILPPHLTLGEPFSRTEKSGSGDFRQVRSQVIGTFEQAYIEEMLRKHDGNVTHAAQEAGKDRRVFGRLIKKYQIDRNNL
jgi:DNA-binding NtrC family response regulator